jgi:hypothetical protein
MNIPARRLAGAGAGLATLVAAGAAASAAPAAAPNGGPIALFATVGHSPSGKIVVAGAIGDWGSTVSIDQNGKPDLNGNFVRVTLKKGSFEIDSTALNKTMANPRPQIASDLTCSVATSGSGLVKLFNGTGLYKGITGTANVTLSFTGIGSRYQSGPRKGQCVHSDNVEPLAMLGSVNGRGTVHFTPLKASRRGPASCGSAPPGTCRLHDSTISRSRG